jgi:uncharacterized membrane protein YeaQ/YmgE (transglycosylase-associated protein family)
MFGYYFNIGIIYFLVGLSAAFIYHFILKRRTLGKFWGALIIGILGSFLGAILDYLLHDVIEFFSNISGSINIFPPLIVSFFVLWLFWTFTSRDG